MRKISAALKENVQEFKKILHVDKNFDLIYREQKLGSKGCRFLFYRWLYQGHNNGKTVKIFLGNTGWGYT